MSQRDLALLPKAHLHLHFTGSMSVSTLTLLAEMAGMEMPEQLIDEIALQVAPDQRGWFRFQRLYDVARKVVNSEAAIRAVVLYSARDDAREGSRRMEIQVDPSTYAKFVGGLAPAVEIIIDAAKQAASDSGIEIGLIIAASRIRHPLEARTLARLAARYAGDGSGEVVGFGLSNDERSGVTQEWEGAFRIARKAGLISVPHGGELLGPQHVRTVMDALNPTRIGHGVRSAEDRSLLDEIANRNITLEVCPLSNVSLGVYPDAGQVPLRTLYDAGVSMALGADDPLLFLSRLNDQYLVARDQGFSDAEIAQLARYSVMASMASNESKREWLADIDRWLDTPAHDDTEPPVCP